MEISARLKSTAGAIEAVVTTDGTTKTIALPAKPEAAALAPPT